MKGKLQQESNSSHRYFQASSLVWAVLDVVLSLPYFKLVHKLCVNTGSETALDKVQMMKVNYAFLETKKRTAIFSLGFPSTCLSVVFHTIQRVQRGLPSIVLHADLLYATCEKKAMSVKIGRLGTRLRRGEEIAANPCSYSVEPTEVA